MNQNKEMVWLVYDGQCPLCQMGSKYYRLKETVGDLQLLDARAATHHPVMEEINASGINIDEGMVFKYQNRLYHGDDALHMMALLSSGSGWLNRIMVQCFRSEKAAKLIYPAMKAARNFILRIKGVPKIKNLKALR